MNKNIRRKLVFLFFVVCVSSCHSSNKKLLSIERFIYHTEDSIPIQSILYLPESELKRLVIEIVSFDQEFKKPNFTSINDSIRHRYILELVFSGTGVCLLSPRIKQSSENIEKMKSQTSETLATDVDNAHRHLKKERRFSRIPIGVMGYSATGIAAAKVAARNTSIDFALLVVTPSTPSINEADYKWINHPETSAVPFYKSLIAEFRTFFPNNTFTYKGKIIMDSQENPIETQFEKCAWESIRTINHEVIQKVNNNDSIQCYAKKIIKENFETEKIEKRKTLNLTGVQKEYTVDEYIDELIHFWYTPQDIDYLKWNPEDYYPKINCPTLMLFAEKDINIDTKGSIENSKRIIERYKKNNFSIVVIPNVDHGFYDLGSKISFEENGRTYTLNKRSELYFESMLNWLESIH
ncbi:S9 family peptidase [Proteiniphilum sp. X52]|uniref:alpha/beta hydrolase family protein n=1 Tax=Proteiniphilum sp. X52 TaxID=2382159 RepID=UPI000F0A8257|nr:hypothetical protein [Proteiniphilum sp. X52]RNC63584.1 hypothetical protein D7D25_15625 [Proteiniphilum sp. X52]